MCGRVNEYSRRLLSPVNEYNMPIPNTKYPNYDINSPRISGNSIKTKTSPNPTKVYVKIGGLYESETIFSQRWTLTIRIIPGLGDVLVLKNIPQLNHHSKITVSLPSRYKTYCNRLALGDGLRKPIDVRRNLLTLL